MTTEPSNDYWKALEDSKRHHATSKTFSGKFLLKHAEPIKEIIERYGIRTILDYGCGKGEQYKMLLPNKQTLEEHWGIEVVKYDPAWPEFAKEPVGKFDLVICTHVLGTIPIKDLEWFAMRLYSHCGNVLYVGERMNATDKNKKNWTDLECPVGWTAMQWIDLLAPLRHGGVKVFLTVAYPRSDGIVYGRFKL